VFYSGYKFHVALKERREKTLVFAMKRNGLILFTTLSFFLILFYFFCFSGEEKLFISPSVRAITPIVKCSFEDRIANNNPAFMLRRDSSSFLTTMPVSTLIEFQCGAFIPSRAIMSLAKSESRSPSLGEERGIIVFGYLSKTKKTTNNNNYFSGLNQTKLIFVVFFFLGGSTDSNEIKRELDKKIDESLISLLEGNGKGEKPLIIYIIFFTSNSSKEGVYFMESCDSRR